MQLTSKAEIDQLHVMSIFTKLFSKDLNLQGIEWSSTQWTKERVILNLCMFSEVICKWFTEDAYLLCVMCTVFGFARWLARHSSRFLLIFMKPKRRCTSVASTVSLLIGIEKKTWLIGCFLDRGDRQPPGLLSLTMLYPLKASGPTHLR